MAEPQIPTGPTLKIEKIYIKDVSFEAPGTPQVFNEQGQPQLSMNLNQKVARLDGDMYESTMPVASAPTRTPNSAWDILTGESPRRTPSEIESWSNVRATVSRGRSVIRSS